MLPDEKIHVVPNCVDDQYLISNIDFEEKVSKISEREIVHILYLSNFIRTKGYAEVLELARYEKDRVEAGGERKFHFDFAGKFFEDAEAGFFENYVKEYELEQYITYHGIVEGEQKQKLLKDSLIFVLPTRLIEGQPISILEAMRNGMMIVTTNDAGIGDIVKDETNGIVIPKDNLDMKQCYTKVYRLLEDDEQVRRIISNNRFEVCNSYTESLYVQKMLKVFGDSI
jgi:glycosyltransferase involved in cell wall biosynthesis